MDVIGIDFTSAPRRQKPITMARCSLAGQVLTVESFTDLYDFTAFEELLAQDGAWIAGMDFPFGQSRKLVENIGWPPTWAGYISLVGNLSRDDFVAALTKYKDPRSYGDREHRRACDELAGSISPQKLYGVPVGKMFHEGAPRLLRCAANIPLLRPADTAQTIIEAYPALVARRFIERQSYKNDTKSKQTGDQRNARQRLMDGLQSDSLREIYGMRIVIDPTDSDRCVVDPTADRLDALLCAIQAGWAARHPEYGIPADADELEGWISDPLLFQQ